MGDLHPDQAKRRRPNQAAPAGGAPGGVRTALGKLRDAAAAHDDELPEPAPAPGPPGSPGRHAPTPPG
jgi:hypothetical protein